MDMVCDYDYDYHGLCIYNMYEMLKINGIALVIFHVEKNLKNE